MEKYLDALINVERGAATGLQDGAHAARHACHERRLGGRQGNVKVAL